MHTCTILLVVFFLVPLHSLLIGWDFSSSKRPSTRSKEPESLSPQEDGLGTREYIWYVCSIRSNSDFAIELKNCNVWQKGMQHYLSGQGTIGVVSGPQGIFGCK